MCVRSDRNRLDFPFITAKIVYSVFQSRNSINFQFSSFMPSHAQTPLHIGLLVHRNNHISSLARTLARPPPPFVLDAIA